MVEQDEQNGENLLVRIINSYQETVGERSKNSKYKDRIVLDEPYVAACYWSILST